MLRITRLCLTALALLALWLFLVNSTSPGPFRAFVPYVRFCLRACIVSA